LFADLLPFPCSVVVEIKIGCADFVALCQGFVALGPVTAAAIYASPSS